MNGVTNGHEGIIPLPSAKPIKVSTSITIQPPLTRRGHGPGLALVVPSGIDLDGSDKTLDPPPLQKWAEEGYAVVQIVLAEGEGDKFGSNFEQAVDTLSKLKECDSVEKIGLICRLYNFLYHRHILTAELSLQCTYHTRRYENYRLDGLYRRRGHLWK
jgi:carboxymethylenebutenolidase